MVAQDFARLLLKLIKNSIITLGGTSIAQVLSLLTMPLLARLYSPDSFGVFYIYFSTLAFLVVAASLRYEMGLLEVQSGSAFASLLRLCAGLNVIFFVMGAIFFYFIAEYELAWTVLPRDVLALIMVGVLGSGVQQITTYVFLREGLIATNAVFKLTQVLIFCLTALGIGYGEWSTEGMIIADVSARIFTALLAVVWMLRIQPDLRRKVTISSVKASARVFRRYPAYTLPGGLVSASIPVVVPIFMLQSYDAYLIGQYALIERVVLAPAGIIGFAVAQAFTSELSRLVVSEKPALRSFNYLVAVMSTLGLLAAAVVFFIGPRIVPIVFGEQWIVAGDLCRAVAVVVLTSIAVMPINMTLILAGRQRLQLTWEISRLVAVVIVWMTMSIWRLPLVQAVQVHACTLALASAAYAALALYVIRVRDIEIRDNACMDL